MPERRLASRQLIAKSVALEGTVRTEPCTVTRLESELPSPVAVRRISGYPAVSKARRKGDASHRQTGDTPPQKGSCIGTLVPIWEPSENRGARLEGAYIGTFA